MREFKSTLLSLMVSAICIVSVSAQKDSATPCEELSFAAPTYFAGGGGPRGLATTDLNGDGNTDLVAANETAGTVTLRFGDGNGNFPTSQQFTAVGASGTAVADLNLPVGRTLAVADDEVVGGTFDAAAQGGGVAGRRAPHQR